MDFLILNFMVALLFTIIVAISGVSPNNKSKIFYGIYCLLFFQLVYFHSSVIPTSVPDLPSYQEDFEQCASYSWHNVSDIFRTNEYAYHYLNKLVACTGSDFTGFLIVVSLIILTSYMGVFLKLSPYPFVSVCILLLTTYSQSIFVLRQHIAVSLIIISFIAIIKKQLPLYLLLCFVAYNFHHSALFFVPIYFLCNISNKKIYIASIILMYVAISYLFSKISILVQFFDVDYDSYIESSQVVSSNVLYISILYLASFIFVLKSKIFEEGLHKLLLTLLIMLVICNIFGSSITLLGRCLLYFQPSVIIAIPVILKNIKEIPLKVLACGGFLCLFMYLHYSVLLTPHFFFLDVESLGFLYTVLVAMMAFVGYRIITRSSLFIE